jgi:acetyl-CoA synthetase
MKNTTEAAAAFLAGRDFILKHRTAYDTAVHDFEWPALEQFNWALDYFDIVATDNLRPALHIVEEDGTETIRSFAELSAASNRVAHFLRGLGARKGDCLMLMLGNEVGLWETLLAAIKLGVVVTPATTLLTTADLQDRVDRGGVRLAVTSGVNVSKLRE